MFFKPKRNQARRIEYTRYSGISSLLFPLRPVRSLNEQFHSTADEHEVLLLSAFDIERNRLFFASSANFIYTLQILSPQLHHRVYMFCTRWEYCRDNVVEVIIGTYGADSKVSSVLSAVRMSLPDHFPESPARELCILTTLARSDPPALEEALRRIKVIRDLELSNIDDPRRKTYPSAEESLKHLLWLSSVVSVRMALLMLIVALNAQVIQRNFFLFSKNCSKCQFS